MRRAHFALFCIRRLRGSGDRTLRPTRFGNNGNNNERPTTTSAMTRMIVDDDATADARGLRADARGCATRTEEESTLGRRCVLSVD